MSEYDNSAILFPNFKKKAAKHPDFTGTGTISGVKYELSAWEKQGRRGKFFSISFKRADDGNAARPATLPGECPSPTGSAEHEPIPDEAMQEQQPRELQPFIA